MMVERRKNSDVENGSVSGYGIKRREAGYIRRCLGRELKQEYA